jgi:LuxR family transcriptional regulator, maltose regulon positive regulatory protein
MRSPQPLAETLIKGAAATLRANIFGIKGDLVDTFVFAQQALDLLPESATYIRAIARTILAHAAHGDGDVTTQREQNAASAVALIRQTGNVAGTLNNITALARLRFLQGRLHLAVATYQEARQLLEERESLQVLEDSVGYYFGLGDIYREWNRLDEAEALLLRCVEPIRGLFAVAHEVVTQGYGSLARLYRARGDYDKAIEALDAFAQVARQQRFTPIQIGQGTAIRAQIDLARGKLAPAIHWAETSGLSTHDELSYPRELSYLILVRVLIAQGRADPAGSYVKDALSLLDRILADAEAKARMGSVLEVLVLQSQAFHAQGERQKALAALERALRLAAPEGYVRIFVDEGEPMLTLLHLAQKHSFEPAYTDALLAASSKTTRVNAPDLAGSPALVEPLTEREREVLRLLYEGASNGEIARRLVVSVNTVKKHVFNICGKLGAQNRTQAIAKARTLDLVK